MGDFDRELQLAQSAVRSAGAAIREAWATQQSQIDDKGTSTDLVTETDRRCEEIIAGMIRTGFPGHRIIGEEDSGSDRYELTNEPTWTIDPIDGTTNFVHRLALSCVLISHVVDKKVMVAVTYDPYADELFWAVEGRGAHLIDRDGKTTAIHVSDTKAVKQALVSMDPGYGRSKLAVQRYSSVHSAMLLKGVRNIRVMGCTGLNMAYVACGRLDAAFEEGSWITGRGPKIWDFAPGKLLIQEAGGLTVDISTGDDDDESNGTPPLTVADRSSLDLLGRSFFCASTRSLADEILQTMDDACYLKTGLTVEQSIQKVQDIIGTDAGGRGMKALICRGDLLRASECLGHLKSGSNVLVLSGFPCCVNESPPTETDGPPGAFAIARAAFALGHRVTVVTDECNRAVFSAALDGLALPGSGGSIVLQDFPAQQTPESQQRFDDLASSANLVIACERAGPASDGNCYTMRGISMNEKGLIAPLHELVEKTKAAGVPFLAIGDGGNEMGMGKVIDEIINSPIIVNGEKIGCVVAADHLVAASVSNWGGYALAAGAALVKAQAEAGVTGDALASLTTWIDRCLPTEEEEIELLNRCVEKGCRDGVSGKVEATVDGMPLERSMKCLRDIRNAAAATRIL